MIQTPLPYRARLMMTENVKLLLVDNKDDKPEDTSEIESLLQDGWQIIRRSPRILEGGVVKTLIVLQNSTGLRPRKPAL